MNTFEPFKVGLREKIIGMMLLVEVIFLLFRRVGQTNCTFAYCSVYFVTCIFHSVLATVLGMTVPICLKAGECVQLVCEVYGYPIPLLQGQLLPPSR